MTGSVWQLVNGVLLIAVFFCVRLCYGMVIVSQPPSTLRRRVHSRVRRRAVGAVLQDDVHGPARGTAVAHRVLLPLQCRPVRAQLVLVSLRALPLRTRWKCAFADLTTTESNPGSAR